MFLFCEFCDFYQNEISKKMYFIKSGKTVNTQTIMENIQPHKAIKFQSVRNHMSLQQLIDMTQRETNQVNVKHLTIPNLIGFGESLTCNCGVCGKLLQLKTLSKYNRCSLCNMTLCNAHGIGIISPMIHNSISIICKRECYQCQECKRCYMRKLMQRCRYCRVELCVWCCNDNNDIQGHHKDCYYVTKL